MRERSPLLCKTATTCQDALEQSGDFESQKDVHAIKRDERRREEIVEKREEAKKNEIDTECTNIGAALCSFPSVANLSTIGPTRSDALIPCGRFFGMIIYVLLS